MAQLITSDVEYKGGLFPTIPSRVPGQDTLLVGVDGIPRLVTDHLTVRDIRKGNFNKEVRVSTALFSTDVSLKAASKNAPYQFDVLVGVDYRVTNSVAYYMAKSSQNIEGSINTGLSRIVTQVAKRFELTNEGVSDDILDRLQEKEPYHLETLGITYTVASVEAKPDADAERNFIKKMTDQELNVMVQRHLNVQTSKLDSRNMEEAIMGRVASGEIDMQTALLELSKINRAEGYSKLGDMEHLISFVRKLQTDNLISDEEAGQRINEFLKLLPSNMQNNGDPMSVKAPLLEEKSTQNDDTLDKLLEEGDE